jgi:hypothetical protein
MKRWKVCSALRRHEEVLEQTERRYGRFGDVLGCHPYLMVTLHQVYAGEELAAVQLVVGEVKDAGEGVAVVCRRQVESR